MLDRMEIHALAEPNRLLTILGRHSHTDKYVRKEFRASFGKYFDNPPNGIPIVGSKCPFCASDLLVVQQAFVYFPDLNANESLANRLDKAVYLDKSFDLHALRPRDPNYDFYFDPDIPECHVALERCGLCRHWRFHYVLTDTFPRGCGLTLDYLSMAAKWREYEAELPDGVPGEAAAWVRRNPSRWHTMHPSRSERLVADVFRSNFHSAEVVHVGKPDDGGVDVLLIESNGTKWLIQAKRRESPHSTEGISTIRNLLGAMVLEGDRYGVVVSTADHFSYRAKQAVTRSLDRGMELRLVDRWVFDRMLDTVLPDRPWLSPVTEQFPFIGHYLAGVIDPDRQLRLFP